ncbi:DNA and RNA helicase-like protein [Bifidobacterium aquikefiri]|uniref:DNA and RNA helicase-like protein n=2 Tax=Bifidobacterium aquikefiri TaxID=1653207 RepID=A0A261G8D2_9BIFI|nr:DNA and RNA helicase-like protein [Bifidobacterium aquikefiri]
MNALSTEDDSSQIDRRASHRDLAPTYEPMRRSRREHHRVVLKGTEHFDADGVKLEAGDMQTKKARDADDDARILGELPPHWGVFTAEKE